MTPAKAPRWHWTRSSGLLGLSACLLAAMAIDGGDRMAVLALGANGILAQPVVHVRVWQMCMVTAIVCAASAAAAARSPVRKAAARGALALGLPSLALGYLTWAPDGIPVSLSSILITTVAGATPLLLGSTAGVLSERSGVINIAIEGQFLAGACSGAVAGSVTHSYWVGLAAGIGAGMVIGLALSLLAIRYRVDQIVAGLILITLVTGLTGYVAQQALDPNSATLNSPPTFPQLHIPGLDRIPVVGQALFSQSLLFYLALAAIAGSELMFARTRLGLRIRASGENPSAALSSGINVRRLRYGVGLVAGGIAGIGGTYFTLGSSGGFLAQMTAGLGYVALAAVIFGGWRTGRAAVAALMFGFATSMATSLGLLNVNVNPNLLLALPYLVTIVVVAGAAASGRAPAADGVPLAQE